MKIRYEQPWFWPIVQHFQPGVDFEKIAISFGDTIYCAKTIPAHLLVHEKVHVKHMRESKFFGVIYYLRYALSMKFRRKCELEAYQAQFDYIRDSHSDKNLVEKARVELAKYMASDVYPGMITFEEALQSLK